VIFVELGDRRFEGDEAIAQVELPGWGERSYYAEILRIRGRPLALKGDSEGAERAYIASLDWAQRQAKSWELRTATSYPRLMRDRGRARSPRPARADLRLVHRGLRHQGPEGGQSVARRIAQ